MADRFEANARVPVSPLDYAHKELARDREIMVDYAKHIIYIRIDGEDYAIKGGLTVEELQLIVEAVLDELEKNPDRLQDILNSEAGQVVIGDIVVTLTNGDVTTLKQGLSDALIKINDLERGLGIVRDELGNIQQIEINVTEIKETPEKQFVTAEQKQNWDDKTDTERYSVVVPSGEDRWTPTDGSVPYIQEVPLEGILATDNPTIDVIMSDDYSTAMNELNNYAHIYRISTLDGKIRIYAIRPTNINLTLQLEVNR